MSKAVLIIGAGKGVGRALAVTLAGQGHHVIGVARTQVDLEALKAETPEIAIEAQDATRDGVTGELVRKYTPDVVLHVGGIRPQIGLLSEYDWEGFSAPWQSDTKISFDLAQTALAGNLPKGGSLIAFASGAAINGSPLSGGYAGAKRTQHFIMNYAQTEADKRDLGLSFTTIYPKQLIAGTGIAGDASAAYAGLRGGDAAGFMSQWDAPLTPAGIADKVAPLVSNPQKGAFAIDGTGMIVLP